MTFSSNQRAFMKELAQRQHVKLEVRVKKYVRSREFGSGCWILIREMDPHTNEHWVSHHISTSKNRQLGIERAKKIARYLKDHGAKDVSCKAE